MKLISLTKVMVTLFLCGTIGLQAQNVDIVDNDKDLELGINTSYASYIRMSTEELQEALEILSINGEHNLEMGLELIRRWTTES